jgi:small subunit ribosomal protein S16
LAVRIRLARVGATKRPSYRVVAIDSRRPRDGRSLEILGFYDPLTEPATVQLHAERIRDWIGRGATPSETVIKLFRQAGLDARAQEAAASAATAAPAKPKPRARKASAPSGAKASA